MTALAQGAAGVAVALGFALLGSRQTGGVAMLCAAQAVVVAIAALARGEAGVAAVELVEAAVLGYAALLPLPLWAWAAKRTKVGGRGAYPRDPSPQPWCASRPTPTRGGGVSFLPLAAGAVLAGLAATIPGTGVPLAVILLGLLLVASRALPAHQALGIAAIQNGLVLAAIAEGLPGWRLALVVLPWLPVLAFGALWLGGDRARTAAFLAPRPAAWIDAALCGLTLLLACALPWQLGAQGPFWRLDALAAHVILLLAALAAASSWARRDATVVWGSQLGMLAGTVLAIASSAPLLSWLGMALATVGASAAALPARAEAWRRLCLGCTGLGLALFGAVALHATTPSLPAIACLMLGYGALAVLAPELTVAAAALILRMRGGPTDGLLLALGLAALLVAALGLSRFRLVGRRKGASQPRSSRGSPSETHGRSVGQAANFGLGMHGSRRDRLGLAASGTQRDRAGLASRSTQRDGPGRAPHGSQRDRLSLAARGPQPHSLPLVRLAQGGAAVFAFGLGTEAGNLAGLLQLSFLALTQCALLLARQGCLDRLAALAGLAGMPPFGLFPSLALILLATAQRLPWLLLPLGAGLAAVAWHVLLQLPPERRLLPSPAWVPLALLLIAGFAMPDPLLAWFRLAAR